ncbi:hypothetical protein OZX57_07085 [Bifidobacterium sp. ESL0682]|uniref:type II secretion system F family protein n=1 Tax=Bifidobacterium sp. ESL0682 TaxID=2983212 RepID=UPI0023F86564|nr:hypothetical protein [Bifidobacterium sp. ESL0682]WEV41728.1 hypothetical protein OZX57_07085 [Bifidobacterium sp. ESL0682]
MGYFPLLSAVLVSSAIILFFWRGSEVSMTPQSATMAPSSTKEKGILSLIDDLRAHVRAGGSLEEAFAGLMGAQPLSHTPCMPNREELQDMLRENLGNKETVEQADQAAAELDLACRLIGTLGCEATHCLDAVAASYKRNRMMKTLKDNAFTVPKSTVKLLSLLPLATLVLGELMGASPIAFLFGNTAGRICLLLGIGTYTLGMLWMKTLMDGVDSSGGQSYKNDGMKDK